MRWNEEDVSRAGKIGGGGALCILHGEEGPNEKGPGRVKGTSGVTVRGGREHLQGEEQHSDQHSWRGETEGKLCRKHEQITGAPL